MMFSNSYKKYDGLKLSSCSGPVWTNQTDPFVLLYYIGNSYVRQLWRLAFNVLVRVNRSLVREIRKTETWKSPSVVSSQCHHSVLQLPPPSKSFPLLNTPLKLKIVLPPHSKKHLGTPIFLRGTPFHWGFPEADRHYANSASAYQTNPTTEFDTLSRSF